MSNQASEKNILSLQLVEELKEVFDKNDWHSDEELSFDEFCEYLENFNNEQQGLLLELTKNFLLVNCGVKSLQAQIVDTVKKLLLHPLAIARKNIWVCPMINPEKSSCSSTYHLVYSLKIMNRTKRGIERSISIVENPIEAKRSYRSGNDLVCLFDDFIGSGETAIGSAKYLIENGYHKEDILILSIVAQEEGIANVRGEGIAALANIERNKGISDSGSRVEEKKRLMEEIENIIKPREDWKFGYRRSEALVKTMRTPNNTFPVFWLPKENNKIRMDAPFVRR